MILPSKELLSSVLNKNIDRLDHLSEDGRYVFYWSYNGIGSSYLESNIYELMHLMKEWACAKDFELYTYKVGDEYWCDEYDGILPYTIQTGSTEFEAVTKACEWILNQQKDK